MSANPYPWLHVSEDGSVRADLQGCTSAEMDRRLVIMQEIEAGRVVVAGEVEWLREALRTIAAQTDEEWTLATATKALDAADAR